MVSGRRQCPDIWIISIFLITRQGTGFLTVPRQWHPEKAAKRVKMGF